MLQPVLEIWKWNCQMMWMYDTLNNRMWFEEKPSWFCWERVLYWFGFNRANFLLIVWDDSCLWTVWRYFPFHTLDFFTFCSAYFLDLFETTILQTPVTMNVMILLVFVSRLTFTYLLVAWGLQYYGSFWDCRWKHLESKDPLGTLGWLGTKHPGKRAVFISFFQNQKNI